MHRLEPQELSVADGIVARLTVGDDGEVEGFVLDTGRARRLRL